MSNKKLPYGNCNFADVIERNFVYVDKTRYIEVLENESNAYQYMLRPRRFGKSLFLSMMGSYYDLKQKDKFASLFGDLYIGKHPTPEQGAYAILSFDFSGVDVSDYDRFRTTFLKKVQDGVKRYLLAYKDMFSGAGKLLEALNPDHPTLGILDDALTEAYGAGVKIFVMIDEYDHFANGLIATGRGYDDEIKKGNNGLVRAFYETLKAGTKSVVRRIFMTGVSPMMVNDLTSSFNMATNLSLLPYYNEMFGFTKDEVEWLIDQAGVDRSLICVDMEYYYNGYMFNNDGKNRVYNSQMILFLFYQILQLRKAPTEIIDTNLRTNYERLQALAENENNRSKLLDIMRGDGIYGRIADRFSIDDLGNDEYFISYLFYMGMLTCGGTFEGETYLKIPNYSIKTLYWEYLMQYMSSGVGEVAIDTSKLSATIKDMAYRGNIKPYLDFFSDNFAKRLSNRDLIGFDEKYIKVMMLSSLYFNRYYHPISERENDNGYTDIYLERNAAISDIKYEYVLEVKYIKTNADKSEGEIAKEKEIKFAEAMAQIEKYKKDKRFAGRDNIKFAAIVFRGKGDYDMRPAA